MQAAPIGTVSIFIDHGVPRRFIKLSHHGHWYRRWRPLARHLWESQVGPIPAGYRVDFRDSQSLHDELGNLVLTGTDRLQSFLPSTRSYSARNQRIRQAVAVTKSNRDRVRVADSQLQLARWYVVLPRSKAIVLVPCRNRTSAATLLTTEALAELCERDRYLIESRDLRPRDAEPFVAGHAIQILRGSQIAAESVQDGACEGFIRLIPDERRSPRKRSKPIIGTQLVADHAAKLEFGASLTHVSPRMAEYATP